MVGFLKVWEVRKAKNQPGHSHKNDVGERNAGKTGSHGHIDPLNVACPSSYRCWGFRHEANLPWNTGFGHPSRQPSQTTYLEAPRGVAINKVSNTFKHYTHVKCNLLYAPYIAAYKSIANWKEQALKLIRTHPQKLSASAFVLNLLISLNKTNSCHLYRSALPNNLKSSHPSRLLPLLGCCRWARSPRVPPTVFPKPSPMVPWMARPLYLLQSIHICPMLHFLHKWGDTKQTFCCLLRDAKPGSNHLSVV